MIFDFWKQPNACPRASAHHARLWGWAWLIALLVLCIQTPVAHAQDNASCGEPKRSQPLDVDKNGVVERTVVLDECYVKLFDYAGVEKKIVVYWTSTGGIAADRLTNIDTNGDGTTDITPGFLGLLVATWTEKAWTTFRDWGFGDPLGRSDFNVHLFDMPPGELGWCCIPDDYQMDAPMIMGIFQAGGSVFTGQSVVIHEMWHAVAGFGLASWATEGGASKTEDMVALDLDNFAGSSYMGRVASYLGGGHETDLEQHAYVGALWWTYFAEQVGTDLNEPARGLDAIRAFYAATGAAHARMDSVIRARGKGNFITQWMNFAIANYTKELTSPALPARMRYADERQAGAPDYPPPSIELVTALSPGATIGPDPGEIEPWSSKYYQFNTGTGVPIINVQVRQETGRNVGYVLLAIRNNEVVRETQSIGRDFNQVWINSNYERVVLIVVGLSEASNFRYSVNATQPQLKIVDPIGARPINVGRNDAPEKLLVKVNLFADGVGTPILGVDPNTIAVRIGNQTVDAGGRVSGAFIQDQYWLLVRAPAQSANGVYDLTVTWGALTATETGAVRYGPRSDSDNMVVIDRSGSMSEFDKMSAARAAARLYVDSWRSGDLVGVASFNENATLDLTLRNWDPGRSDALTAIANIPLGGNTSIGDGAQAGLDELIARGNPAHTWAIILLSDGIENEPIKVQDYLNVHNARLAAVPPQKVPVVHAVALGPDADRAKMEKLASDTGGRYFVVALPAAAAANTLSPTATQAAYLTNDLAEIYRVASEAVAGQQQVYLGTSILSFDDPIKEHLVTIDGAADEAIFVLKWNADGLGANVTLLQPDNNPAPPPDVVDSLHQVWRIPAPQPGQWKLTIDFQANCDPCAEEALVEAAVVSTLNFDLYLGLPVEQRLVGNPMPIFASLVDSAPIAGATLTTLIDAPNGGVYSVTLYDDGAHGDGAAGDGFYGGMFYQTQSFGGYNLVAQATGTGNDGTPFVRRLRAGFNMLQFRLLDLGIEGVDPNRVYDPNNVGDLNKPYVDSDGDGIIDWWEIEWGLDPDLSNPNTANEDPDFDGLTHLDEFNLGTNPRQSDSDGGNGLGGGENDGSEVTQGSNPNQPDDDEVPCMLAFSTSSVHQHSDVPEHAGGVVLNYDVAPDHAYFFIWRSELPDGPRTLLTDAATLAGTYHDESAEEGKSYDYWISGYDSEGHASCILGPVRGTVRADGVPPEGVVTINDWATTTLSTSVSLRLEASVDTTEMKVGHTADLRDVEWEPYATGKPWTLTPRDAVGFVYVLYRDAEGNVSEMTFDTILIDTPGAVDGRRLSLPLIQR